MTSDAASAQGSRRQSSAAGDAASPLSSGRSGPARLRVDTELAANELRLSTEATDGTAEEGSQEAATPVGGPNPAASVFKPDIPVPEAPRPGPSSEATDGGASDGSRHSGHGPRASRSLKFRRELANETKAALQRLNKVTASLTELEGELASRPTAERLQNILASKEQQAEPQQAAFGGSSLGGRGRKWKASTRVAIRMAGSAAHSMETMRQELFQDLQGWTLRALSQSQDVRGASFSDEDEDNGGDPGDPDEDEDIPCKTCGKSNGMIMRIEEEFEAKARSLRESLAAAMEQELDQKMEERAGEMEEEMQRQARRAIKEALSDASAEKAELCNQLSMLQTTLKKQGRGGAFESDETKHRVAELEAKIASLERAVKDARDEKEIFKREADALKRKDMARTQHMAAESQTAKAGAQGLQGQLQELNSRIQEQQMEINERKLKGLDQERAVVEMEGKVKQETKARAKLEAKCAQLEEDLSAAQERAKAAQALQLKLGGQGGEFSFHEDGTPRAVPSSQAKAERRKQEAQIREMTQSIHENEGRVSFLESKIQEKDHQLQQQVGTMMKMDSDVDRLLKCINEAREKLVDDIRSGLRAVFEVAKKEELMLLDTVVTDNKFFQTRIGHHLLAPRVARLEGLLMEALSAPFDLQMETAYMFPSVPKEDILEHLQSYAESTGGALQQVPGTPAPQTKLAVGSKAVHWEPGRGPRGEADAVRDPASDLAQLEWGPVDPQWAAWVSPMARRTPAPAMLAESGPSRVTFNSPCEVMMSQNERRRQYPEYLALERLPVHPLVSDMAGPRQRQRPWSASRQDSTRPLARPGSAPLGQQPEGSGGSRMGRRSQLVSSPHKGFPIERRVDLQAREEQLTASATRGQAGPEAPALRCSVQPIGSGANSPGGRAQFYRISEAADDGGAGRPGLQSGLHPAPGASVLPLPSLIEGRQSPPQRRPGQMNRTGVRLAPDADGSPAAAGGTRHTAYQMLGKPDGCGDDEAMAVVRVPSTSSRDGSPSRDGSRPHDMQAEPLEAVTIGGALGPLAHRSSDVYGDELGTVPTLSPMQQPGSRLPESPSSQLVAELSSQHVGLGSPPGKRTLAQVRHQVVQEFALHSANGEPQVLQQQLANALQQSREKWASERRKRLELENQMAEMELRISAQSFAPAAHKPPESPNDEECSRPTSGSGAKRAGRQGEHVGRPVSVDGAASVGGWSDASNDAPSPLPNFNSSEQMGIATIPEAGG